MGVLLFRPSDEGAGQFRAPLQRPVAPGAPAACSCFVSPSLANPPGVHPERIVVKSVEDLGEASWRPLDKTHAGAAGQPQGRRPPEGRGRCGRVRPPQERETAAFDVAEATAAIGRTLFVPKGGNTLRFSVVKRHRLQKDALIGEAEEVAAPKHAGLRLVRRGKERGTLFVQITESLHSDPKGSAPPNPVAVARAPRAPARPCGCLPFSCF
ncbi:unnamed protein product [Prorocentrum cordatum]|uniref:Uncharacterized protein n=1 Tax=Prorocentrum cordatum TaxID=2364126 RepID=A0ABN9RA75_9DINO|nr:unnamed protein product [Polarella glacialis]